MSRKTTIIAVLVGVVLLAGIAAFALVRGLTSDGPRGPVEAADQTACRDFQLAVAASRIETTIEAINTESRYAASTGDPSGDFSDYVDGEATESPVVDFANLVVDAARVPLISEDVFEALTDVVASSATIQAKLTGGDVDNTIFKLSKNATDLDDAIAHVESVCAA